MQVCAYKYLCLHAWYVCACTMHTGRPNSQSPPLPLPLPSTVSYYAERCHPQGEPQAPSYSFGVRTQQNQQQISPSPNSYVLPSLLGSGVIGKRSSASYSMTGRSHMGSFHEDKQNVCVCVSVCVCVCVCVCARECVHACIERDKYESTPKCVTMWSTCQPFQTVRILS